MTCLLSQLNHIWRPGLGLANPKLSAIQEPSRAQCHFHKECSHVIVKYYQGFVLEVAHVTLLVLHVHTSVFRTQLQLLGN